MLSGGYFLEEVMDPALDLMEALRADWPMMPPVKKMVLALFIPC